MTFCILFTCMHQPRHWNQRTVLLFCYFFMSNTLFTVSVTVMSPLSYRATVYLLTVNTTESHCSSISCSDTHTHTLIVDVIFRMQRSSCLSLLFSAECVCVRLQCQTLSVFVLVTVTVLEGLCLTVCPLSYVQCVCVYRAGSLVYCPLGV